MFRSTYVFCLVVLLGSTAANAQGRPPRDAINLSQVQIYNSPPDVASWPVTTAITAISMRPSGDPLAGLVLQFSAQQTWPDYTPPGWDGPLEYTVWAIWYANGQWSASGIIQMWRGRPSTGGPIMTDFARNWIYDGRWGPDWGHQPVPGELMGFFVTAGNARGVGGVTSVRERSNVVTVAVPGNDYGDYTFPAHGHLGTNDFDGDGITDAILFRPSSGEWYIGESSTLAGVGIEWGTTNDIPVAGDYDGDGLTDVAVFRPSTGMWYIRSTATGAMTTILWGGAGDIPVPGDYDGDGRTDIAIFRPSNGGWYIRMSSTSQGVTVPNWGGQGDIPILGDYDGDGKTDIAVFRPSNGGWYIRMSSTSQGVMVRWGGQGDIPVRGDFDGDGKADIAVFRPSTGDWYIWQSSNSATHILWGGAGDIPVSGDFDGDGKTDIVVFRPSNGTWYGILSASSTTRILHWGASGDMPAR